MDIMKVVNQAKDICFNPKGTLKKLKDEKITKESLLIYLGIVALPTLIGVIIGQGIVGVSVGWGFYSYSYTVPLGWAVAGGISQYILMIISVIVFGYVVNFLAPSFSSKQNLMQSMKLVAYAITPVLIAGIFNIFPPLSIIVFLALIYSLYILYIGLPIYLETPKNEKRIIYIIVAIVIYAVIIIVIGIIVSALMWGLTGYNPTTSIPF